MMHLHRALALTLGLATGLFSQSTWAQVAPGTPHTVRASNRVVPIILGFFSTFSLDRIHQVFRGRRQRTYLHL
jgi:hypothetical protein